MSTTDILKQAFAPVVNEGTRVLILGSLPGDASLKAAQYYAHPQNGFWRLVGSVIDQDLVTLDYETRLDTLTGVGIGLWDVVASARRKGSLDADIRDIEQTNLTSLIARLPNLGAIAFNGQTAARIGHRHLTDFTGCVITLPSSSAAHTRSIAEKTLQWLPIRRFLILEHIV